MSLTLGRVSIQMLRTWMGKSRQGQNKIVTKKVKRDPKSGRLHPSPGPGPPMGRARAHRSRHLEAGLLATRWSTAGRGWYTTPSGFESTQPCPPSHKSDADVGRVLYKTPRTSSSYHLSTLPLPSAWIDTPTCPSHLIHLLPFLRLVQDLP